MLIKSLRELNLNQSLFPLFYKDEFIQNEISFKNEIFIYVEQKIEALVIFKVTKLKIISKGQFLYTPCNFNGVSLNNDEERIILNLFIEFLKRERIVDVLLPPIHFSNFRSIPKKCSFYQIGIIQRKNIGEDANLLQKMKPNYRNEIKKLIENKNVVISSGLHLLSESYELIKTTLSEQGLKCDSYEFFKNLQKNLQNDLYISNCQIKGETYGTVIFIFDLNSAYYLYSGNKKTTDYPGINKLLIFNAIEFFKQKGIKNVILGGFRNEELANSKIVGIQKFKLRFGAEIENGYHFIKVINPFKYFIFNVLLKIKSRITGQKLELINLNGLEIKYSRN